MSKRFAVRDSVCLNCIYEYKKALLPFMKTFWVPRLGSSLIFCDYMKTLLSFGITVLRTVRAGRGLAIYLRGAEDASTIRKTIDNAVCITKVGEIARRRRIFFKELQSLEYIL